MPSSLSLLNSSLCLPSNLLSSLAPVYPSNNNSSTLLQRGRRRCARRMTSPSPSSPAPLSHWRGDAAEFDEESAMRPRDPDAPDFRTGQLSPSISFFVWGNFQGYLSDFNSGYMYGSYNSKMHRIYFLMNYRKIVAIYRMS